MMSGGEEATVEELRGRLRRYTAERYPIQHATTQFHLGVALSRSERFVEAEAALRRAADLFGPASLPVEHAKAANALGAVLRARGELLASREAFERAAEIFEPRGQELERAAALYNLGLVRRDLDDAEGAIGCFRDAREIFERRRLPAQTGAASRELGAALLAQGALESAKEELSRGVELAVRTGDQAGRGAAANTLGLVHLAAGEGTEAIGRFREAAGAHPRSLRPADHAMAKANLALAYERSGNAPRSRLAAAQAAATPGAPEPVRTVASGVLTRLGQASGDLRLVLDQEPLERWSAIIGEELARWVDAAAGERRSGVAEWIDGLIRSASPSDLAEAFLNALLELPPPSMNLIIEGALRALSERQPEDRERLRFEVSAAMYRFPVPQLLRLKDTFNRLAGELGQEPEW